MGVQFKIFTSSYISSENYLKTVRAFRVQSAMNGIFKYHE